MREVSRSVMDLLPPELRVAQEAIHHPEVRDMLQKLSKYNLGICMPHMHDARTGDFQVLPRDTVQVEAGLKVSFRKKSPITEGKSIAVAWQWDDDDVDETSECSQVCMLDDDDPNDVRHVSEHL